MANSGGKRPRLVADRRYPPGKGTAGRKAGGKKAGNKGSGGKGRKPARTARKAAPRRRTGILSWPGRLLRWCLRIVFRLGLALACIVFLLIAGGVFYYQSTLPPVADLLDARARGSVTLQDDDGKVFAWRGDQYGGAISATSVSPYLRDAVVATEDRRFYHHFGISPRGIASAIRINLSEGRGPLSGHGGSTITQQTAKLLCLGRPYDPDKWKNQTEYEADCRQTTLWRKVKEAVYAMAMEVKYTKNEILTIYLNRAYLGAGARGFAAASERYFGKPAANVTPAEAAMLAGLLKAPTTFAPTNNLARSQNRADLVIGLMEDQGYLTHQQAQQARAHPAQLSKAAQTESGGYFADWVMSTGPDFLTRKTTEDVVIRTTLDQRIQHAAETAMKDVFENKVKDGSKAQAAIVVMSADGAVRAMVGGRRTGVSGLFNRAVQARRQTGSAFKPFVYATALDLGYSPFDLVNDTPLTIDIPGSGPWTPKDYSGRFRGTVTLTEALKDSLNIPAVRISESVGRNLVRKVANDFGLHSELAEGPALALGASESTLIGMTGAYAGILNGGSSVTPYGLVELRLRGEDKPLMDQGGGIGERVIGEKADRELIYMMSRVVADGTGHRAQLQGREVAGKTGTTQAARDAWFIGFTADYVAGVWMGYDDNTPLTGVTGGGLPAEIWHEVMKRVTDGTPAKPLPMWHPPARKPAPEAQPQLEAQGAPVRKQRPPQRENAIQRVLRDLLGVN